MVSRLGAAVTVLVLASCATIVGDATHTMPIASKPDGATVSIKDEKGVLTFKGQTPTTVTLSKSDGSYFGGKTYYVTVSKDGFDPQTFTVKATPNGWYIGGNLIFGGLIGWLIVDPLTGKMYKMSMERVDATLSQTRSEDDRADRQIRIVSIDQIPAELHGRLVPLTAVAH